MKHYILTFILLLSVISLQAQETDIPSDSVETEEEEIIIDKTIQPFVFGMFEFSNTPQGYLESLSGGAGIIFKGRFIIGGFATRLQAPITEKVIFPNDFDFSFSHGGILLGYRTDRRQLFDFAFTMRASYGEAVWAREEIGGLIIGDKFAMINPAVGVDINASKYLKVISRLGYRRALNLSLARVAPNDINGITFQVGLSVGLFNELDK